jgi:hypothetical protein
MQRIPARSGNSSIKKDLRLQHDMLRCNITMMPELRRLLREIGAAYRDEAMSA